jgi:signal transduction histidine kinase
MRPRHRTFLQVFRARHPLASDRFRRLRDKVASGGGGRGLRDFFVELNRELRAVRESNGETDVSWATDLCLELIGANSEGTVATLGALLNETTLQFDDPLVGTVFEAAGKTPALLLLLADLVETEHQLLKFRVRAVEALVTKSPGDVDTATVGLGAQPALRFLNSVLDEMEKGSSTTGLDDAYGRWAEGFGALARAFQGAAEAPLLEWMAEALRRLAGSPTARETLRLVLKITRVNSPLPFWHPAGAPAAAGLQWAKGSVGALIVDKAIQVVLGAAAAGWRASAGVAAARPARPDLQPWPFNEHVLEATLIDVRQPPRTRAMAASLLRILAHASPSVRLSPRAELYAFLFLTTRGDDGTIAPDWPAPLTDGDSERQLDLLLEALGDDCDAIRRAASQAGHQAALQHPASFQPRHYTKLLPLLSDDDRAIRECTMLTFQALAGFRSRRVAAVVDDIAARLHGDDEMDDEEERARRDLESALGITMDRLVDDVEQLQREVHALEARRGELLQYMETQAVRVGEEIHLEVLNTLTGYLATAVDERDYGEATRRLDHLVAELRRIMNNLYPRDLETEGFLQTIRNRLRDTQAQMSRRTAGCAVRLDCSPGVTDTMLQACLAEPAHLVLVYRIVLEAIVNARKHSGGTFIGVSVRAPSPDRVEIAICDDGVGHGGPFGENVGMALMRRRAEEIGGEITYRAGPTGGTTVIVRLARSDAAGPSSRELARLKAER